MVGYALLEPQHVLKHGSLVLVILARTFGGRQVLVKRVYHLLQCFRLLIEHRGKCLYHRARAWNLGMPDTVNGSSASISAWLRNHELAPAETARAGGRLTELLFSLSLTKGLGGSAKGSRSLSVSTSPLM